MKEIALFLSQKEKKIKLFFNLFLPCTTEEKKKKKEKTLSLFLLLQSLTFFLEINNFLPIVQLLHSCCRKAINKKNKFLKCKYKKKI